MARIGKPERYRTAPDCKHGKQADSREGRLRPRGCNVAGHGSRRAPPHRSHRVDFGHVDRSFSTHEVSSLCTRAPLEGTWHDQSRVLTLSEPLEGSPTAPDDGMRGGLTISHHVPAGRIAESVKLDVDIRDKARR